MNIKIQIQRIRKFIKSLFFHINRGLPKANQKQIEERYKICSSCEYVSKDLSQCLKCGCNISTKKIFLNKLAWADQKCPVDKWSEV